jgi:type II secretory pathway component PulF
MDEVDQRIETRLRHLFQTLAWAQQQGIPAHEALRASRPGILMVVAQTAMQSTIFVGPIAPFVGPIGPLNQAIHKLEKDLRAGVSVATTCARHLAPFMATYWLARLRQAENQGTLTETLEWLARQPGLLRPHSARQSLVMMHFIPLGIILLGIAFTAILIVPNLYKMVKEMGLPGSRIFISHIIISLTNFMLYQVPWLLLAALLVFLLLLIRPLRRFLKRQWLAVPGLGRLGRWQRQSEAAMSLAMALDAATPLAQAVTLVESGSTDDWTLKCLARAQHDHHRGVAWHQAWQAAGLVDAGDAWLLTQGQRQEQPGQALSMLSTILGERVRLSRNLRFIYYRIGLTLGQGLLVLAVTCMVFPPLIQIVAELVENAP